MTSWRSLVRVQYRPPLWFWLLVFLLFEALLAARVTFVAIFFTAIMWTVYILAVDGIVLQRTGRSLISEQRWFFLVFALWSIVCWLVFEGYNLHLQNWRYVGLPDDLVVSGIGYAWAFATIFPGIFETYDLLRSFGLFANARGKPLRLSPTMVKVLFVAGVVCLIVPLAVPTSTATFLFGLVWIGFVLLLDPVTERLGGESLLADLRQGALARLYQLLVAGAICGFLWEFWNYWAIGKWIYSVPAPLDFGPKIFEMPMLGFLGFPPFAVECFVFQSVLMALLRRSWDDRTNRVPSERAGYHSPNLSSTRGEE